jgi:hypothetical protein
MIFTTFSAKAPERLPAEDGEVLGEDVDEPAVDGPMAGDDAVAYVFFSAMSKSEQRWVLKRSNSTKLPGPAAARSGLWRCPYPRRAGA